MRTRIFLSRGRIPSTAANTAKLICAGLLSLPFPAATQTIPFRLSPGPRLVGTRADSSGGGSGTATLRGDTLTLHGSFHGMLGMPTAAHLRMGSLPGVRGPILALLLAVPSLSGTVQLKPEQITAFHDGRLYVEIDSERAPEGDLWGWITPH
jgi:hypothetical protein